VTALDKNENNAAVKSYKVFTLLTMRTMKNCNYGVFGRIL
jgi:hypothetical protein